MSVTQEVWSKQSLVNIYFFSLQVFQSQITALQDEMDEKGQEMDKLQQELKDKEVENRIAGKKGDQLVRVCFFCFLVFSCLFNLTIIICSVCFSLKFVLWWLLSSGFILFCRFAFDLSFFLFICVFLLCVCFVLFFVVQAPVVRRLDNVNHRINHYPVDKC